MTKKSKSKSKDKAAKSNTKSTRAKNASAASAAPRKTAAAAKGAGIGETIRAAVDVAAALVGAATVAQGVIASTVTRKKTRKTVDRAGQVLKAAAGVTAAAGALVDLNRAAPEALTSLKHIGPARARKILDARPFASIEDLSARGILPRHALEDLRQKLTV